MQPDDDTLFPDEHDDTEGLFDPQLSLPLPSVPAPSVFRAVVKRDGTEAPFDRAKIADAIYRAAETVGNEDRDVAASLAAAVEIYLSKRVTSVMPSVDHVHDAVERVLIQMSHPQVALAYARYRDRRARIRRLREGDMRVLLSELEESRFAREAAQAKREAPLFVRTSAETITAWDQRKIADALVREAGLDQPVADIIAHEVEQQIDRAGIKDLTTSLVRELVGAKLIEHGLDEFRDRHRRLGVPLYDTENILRGRTPETIAQHPGATDEYLARAVKKEYALAQVYAPAVAEAHLRGDIHLCALDRVDRMHGANHALAYVAEHGITAPGGIRVAEPAKHGDTLLAHMVKHDELMRHFFAGPVRWVAVNNFFAPYLYGLEMKEQEQFAQMMVYEYAYRSLAIGGETLPSEIELCWSVPAWLKDVPATGPGGEVLSNTYGEFEHTAQQFAWAVLEQLTVSAESGVRLPSPRVNVRLDAEFLKTPGHNEFLLHAAQTAESRHPLAFTFARENTPMPVKEDWSAGAVTLPPVVLNLPRAGFLAGKESALEAELERLLAHAVQAHKDRRDFLETLAASDTTPLGMVASAESETPYATPTAAIAPIALEGLYECVRFVWNLRLGEDAEAADKATQLLEQLRDRCAVLSEQEGLRLTLAANDDPRAGHRFATIDSAEFPKSFLSIFEPKSDADAPGYSTGLSLPASAEVRPLDRAQLDGRWHPSLMEAPPTRVSLPASGMSADSIADFLRKLYRDANCRGVSFE